VQSMEARLQLLEHQVQIANTAPKMHFTEVEVVRQNTRSASMPERSQVAMRGRKSTSPVRLPIVRKGRRAASPEPSEQDVQQIVAEYMGSPVRKRCVTHAEAKNNRGDDNEDSDYKEDNVDDDDASEEDEEDGDEDYTGEDAEKEKNTKEDHLLTSVDSDVSGIVLSASGVTPPQK
jgi:cobalamin biosynthesis protein CobT